LVQRVVRYWESGAGSTDALPWLPPEVAELLPHAVLLWQSAVLMPSHVSEVEELLDVGDVNGDRIPEIVFSRKQEVVASSGDEVGDA